MKKIILLAKMVGALCLIFLVLILGVYIKYRLELKDIQSLVEDYKPSVATTIYDKNNKVVDILAAEDREVVKLSEVSPYLKDAFISI